MDVKGTLKEKTYEQEGVSKKNGNPYKVAEYLLEIPGDYVKHAVFKVMNGQNDRIARFDSMIGKMVTVSFDINAREYNGHWYNELSAWGIIENNPQKTEQKQDSFDELKQKDAVAAAAVKLNEQGEKLPF